MKMSVQSSSQILICSYWVERKRCAERGGEKSLERGVGKEGWGKRGGRGWERGVGKEGWGKRGEKWWERGVGKEGWGKRGGESGGGERGLERGVG